ncbi:MAG TPA: VWA domain-containing protein [Polyangiaceae bacterium]
MNVAVPSLTPGAAERERARKARMRTLLRVLVLFGIAVAATATGFAYPMLMRGEELLAARWEYPWALGLLVLVPFVLWRATFGEDRRLPRLRLGTVGPLPYGPVGARVWFRDAPGALRAASLSLLILALARPVDTRTPQVADEEGIDIVVVLDLSGSMQAVMDNVPEDLKRYVGARPRGLRPTRLDAAKAVIRDFISRRKTDRIGVVVFGASAYVLSPPTLDYALLDLMVSRMELKLIDPTATAIGDAVGVAVARLRRSSATSKAVILLTDGDNKGGRISPEYAAHLATTVGAKLYTIQIGEGEAAEVHDGFDLFGQPRYVSVPYPTNPELLKQLAAKTGGATYVATDATALQASFHDVLDKLEKTQFEASVASFQDLFGFLLLPGVLLLALDVLTRATLLRRFP